MSGSKPGRAGKPLFMNSGITLTDIIAALPGVASQHARTTPTYALLEKAAAQAIKTTRFGQTHEAHETIAGFGEIELPYHKMGAVDSLDLFGLDELIIFAYYWNNRARYRRAADIGANLGLHSIMMSRCGWSVKAYEPDPKHAALLERNLGLNQANSVELVRAAVSDRVGEMEFVRVLGNTTSSHLAGAKANPYGELERFAVDVVSIAEIMNSADFVKLDAEGQEKIIILGTTANQWAQTDMMVEIGSEDNARAVYSHLDGLHVNAFAQKLGWARVESHEDMPITYKEGSLFVTQKDRMEWRCQASN
jgi:FkbM family methyltransferase